MVLSCNTIPAPLHPSTGGNGAGGAGDRPGVSQRGGQSPTPQSPSLGTAQRCVHEGLGCPSARSNEPEGRTRVRAEPSSPTALPTAAPQTDRCRSSASSFPSPPSLPPAPRELEERASRHCPGPGWRHRHWGMGAGCCPHPAPCSSTRHVPRSHLLLHADNALRLLLTPLQHRSRRDHGARSLLEGSTGFQGHGDLGVRCPQQLCNRKQEV